MENNIHYDILSFIGGEIVAELYATAKKDNRIMVCDWRAYAIHEAYRLYGLLMGTFFIPEIDDCFNGSAVPEEIKSSEKWKELGELHNYHWDRYNTDIGEYEYSDYLNQSVLVLDHFRLSL